MNYIIFRVYSYFKSKENGRDKTTNFLAMLAGSLLYLLFFIVNGLTKIYVNSDYPNPRMKYYIGIPIAIILLKLSQIVISRKFNNNGFVKLEEKYKGRKNFMPIWVIFIAPILIIVGVPIIYGFINGTLRFPLLDK